MSASAKLSTAVQALCYLSETFPSPKTSIEIAKNINVNASKLRKVLSYLVKCDIVNSSQGSSGGFNLKKSPDNIDLQEIYCAVEERKAFHLNFNNKAQNKQNNKISNHNNYFLNLFAEIQIDIEEKMKQITLKKIIESINE